MGFYNLCSENEGDGQLRGFVFTYPQGRFSHDAAQICKALRKHPHMFYTPSFNFLYSRKCEMRGTQNEGLFSGLD